MNNMKNTTVVALSVGLLAAAFAGAAHAQGSQPPAPQLRTLQQRGVTVGPAQTPPGPAIPPNPCTEKNPAATPPNPCTPANARYAAKMSPPPLSITPATPAFVVAQPCRAGAPFVTLNVVLRNLGNAPLSTRIPLSARDQGRLAWLGTAPMPTLAPGASANVSIVLYPPTQARLADGEHHFTVGSAFGATRAPIVVALPTGVCAGVASRFKASIVAGKPVPAPMLASAAGYTTQRASSASAQSRAPTITPEEARLAGRHMIKPASPSGVATTADPKACTDHGGLGGGFACAALLPQGRLALVWSWSGTLADGFNVYRVDGGQRTRVGRQANGKDVTFYVIDPIPADGYSGKCYAVSAYRGAEESDLSASACTDAGRVMQTANLTPGSVDSSTRANQNQTGIAYPPAGEIYVFDSGAYTAGYDYYREVSFWGDYAHSEFSRLAILFDITPISNKVVYTAHLKLTVGTTKVNQDPNPQVNSNHSTSCVKRVGLGTANWWLYRGDWIEATTVTTPRIDQVGPNVDIDVTDIVRGWAQAPNSNSGLVLMGDNENLSTFTNAACRTAYDPASVHLEVQFF